MYMAGMLTRVANEGSHQSFWRMRNCFKKELGEAVFFFFVCLLFFAVLRNASPIPSVVPTLHNYHRISHLPFQLHFGWLGKR